MSCLGKALDELRKAAGAFEVVGAA